MEPEPRSIWSLRVVARGDLASLDELGTLVAAAVARWVDEDEEHRDATQMQSDMRDHGDAEYASWADSFDADALRRRQSEGD